MNILLNLEYDLRPELSAYHRLLRQLCDVQADLQRTAFLRAARPSHSQRARAYLWLARALADLAFSSDDLTVAEHLDSLALGQTAAAAILAQAQIAADPETIYLAALMTDLLAQAGLVLGIIASRLAELGLLDGYLLPEPAGGDN